MPIFMIENLLGMLIMIDVMIMLVYMVIVTPGFKEQSQVHLIHAPRRQHI
jgi:hypothetical protein